MCKSMHGVSGSDYDAGFGTWLTSRSLHAVLTQERHLSCSRASVKHVECSYVPYSFELCVMKKEERKQERRRKKDSKMKFSCLFLSAFVWGNRKGFTSVSVLSHFHVVITKLLDPILYCTGGHFEPDPSLHRKCYHILSDKAYTSILHTCTK